MASEKLAYLLERYYEGQLSSPERVELLQLIHSGQNEEQLNELVLRLFEDDSKTLPEMLDAESSRMILASILAADRPIAAKESMRPAVPKIKRWRWVAAACIMLLLAGGGYWMLAGGGYRRLAGKKIVPALPAGKEGAILTLGDGRQVVLDSLGNGTIATQSGSKVVLLDGKLLYEAGTPDEEIAWNTMTTPRGRQFQLMLPDGSHVWLNAASSITYPAAFPEKRREVTVTGEAYFEIAKNVGVPFHVKVGIRDITVLGTHFNVNAYDNEPSMNTTLLEGAVRVSQADRRVLLHPGEQAQATDALKVVGAVDLGKVMAWKSGLFNFDGLGVQEVMRQLERWYNIEVIYEGPVPDEQFYGEIGKQMSLNDLLETLRMTRVKVRMQGERKLIVTQ